MQIAINIKSSNSTGSDFGKIETDFTQEKSCISLDRQDGTVNSIYLSSQNKHHLSLYNMINRDIYQVMLASQKVLAIDWESVEEDEAWAHL